MANSERRYEELPCNSGRGPLRGRVKAACDDRVALNPTCKKEFGARRKPLMSQRDECIAAN